MMKRKIINIVIADDDDDDQLFLRKAIHELYPDYNLISVYNGTELMDYLLRKGSYINEPASGTHCIFLDINMPLLNGFGALERLKNCNNFKDIPVHILSTCNLEEDKIKAQILGASGFHTKVCSPDKLKALVFNILSQIKIKSNSGNISFTP